MVPTIPKAYSPRSRGLVQAVAGPGSCLAPFLVASMVVAAPTIGSDLQADVSLLPWLSAALPGGLLALLTSISALLHS